MHSLPDTRNPRTKQSYLEPKEGIKTEDSARRFLQWLHHTKVRWLIILDDIQKPGDIRNLWPPPTPYGRTLATTRRRDIPRHHRRQTIDVDLFSEDESLKYLCAKIGHDHNFAMEDAQLLAQDLGYLPLALAQATALISYKKYTISYYRRRLASEKRRLADVLPDAEILPDDHRETVAATWSLSIEFADQLSPKRLARPLFRLASLLDPNGIPLKVFYAPSVLKYISNDRTSMAEADDVWDALRNLHSLSLASVSHDSPERGVRVHALVQRATREEMTQPQQQDAVRIAADALVFTITPEQISMPDSSPSRLIHADNVDSLRANGDTYLWDPENGAHLLLFRSGEDRAFINSPSTTDYYNDLHKVAARILGRDHPDTLSALYSTSYWLHRSGNHSSAVESLEKLLSDYQRVLGTTHHRTLASRRDLAYYRGASGDITRAIADLEELLFDYRKILGDDHPQILTIRRDIIFYKGLSEDAASAIEDLASLLQDYLRILGERDPQTFVTICFMHHLRGPAGDEFLNSTLMKTLLPVYRQLLGSNHPRTLSARRDLIHYKGTSGDFIGAIADLEDLLLDYQRTSGTDHADTLLCRSNIAYWQGLSGDTHSAIATLKELLVDEARIFGPAIPDILGSRQGIAFWLAFSGDVSGAVRILRKLLSVQQRTLGPKHAETLITKKNIDYWMQKAGH